MNALVSDAVTGHVLNVPESSPETSQDTLKFRKYLQSQRNSLYYVSVIFSVATFLFMLIGVILAVVVEIVGNKGAKLPHSLFGQLFNEATTMLGTGSVFFVIAVILFGLGQHLGQQKVATPWSMVLDRIDEENQIMIGYHTRIVYWLAHHVQSALLKKLLSPRYAQRFLEIQSVSMKMELIAPAERSEKQPMRYNV